jgi:hypothetical protein
MDINYEIQMNKCSSNFCLDGDTWYWWFRSFYVYLFKMIFKFDMFETYWSMFKSNHMCEYNGSCLINFDNKPFGYSCQYLSNFTEQIYEINVDDCIWHSCKYGRCIDKIDGFICQCYDEIWCDIRVIIEWR